MTKQAKVSLIVLAALVILYFINIRMDSQKKSWIDVRYLELLFTIIVL